MLTRNRAAALLAFTTVFLSAAALLGQRGSTEGAPWRVGVARAQSSTMYISNISLGGFGTGKGAQREFVGAADIEDTDGNPVAGAFVEGKFYGECHRKTTTGSALTVLIDGGLVARAGVYDPKLGGCGSGCVQWFEVTNVTKSGYTWDPDQGAGTLAGTLCR